ncbi:MAG: hypothetical protein H6642_13995 [Caldilineaceae bacterium]|nr:hypothetical protein [Caldilineaceae bacterium]
MVISLLHLSDQAIHKRLANNDGTAELEALLAGLVVLHERLEPFKLEKLASFASEVVVDCTTLIKVV